MERWLSRGFPCGDEVDYGWDSYYDSFLPSGWIFDGSEAVRSELCARRTKSEMLWSVPDRLQGVGYYRQWSATGDGDYRPVCAWCMGTAALGFVMRVYSCGGFIF